jgi:hypothetical protein
MAVTTRMDKRPPKQSVDKGTYALCVSNEQFMLLRYDKVSPLRSKADWKEVDEFSRESAPPLNLQGAEFVPDSNGQVWVFARSIEAEHEIEELETDQTEEAGEKTTQARLGKYVIHFDNGQEVMGNSQSEVMASAVDMMIKGYDLLEKITLPYMSGYKNALINNKPEHPDGRPMEREFKLSGGYYIPTKMSGSQKKEYLAELAEECGAGIEFVKGWD